MWRLLRVRSACRFHPQFLHHFECVNGSLHFMNAFIHSKYDVFCTEVFNFGHASIKMLLIMYSSNWSTSIVSVPCRHGPSVWTLPSQSLVFGNITVYLVWTVQAETSPGWNQSLCPLYTHTRAQVIHQRRVISRSDVLPSVGLWLQLMSPCWPELHLSQAWWIAVNPRCWTGQQQITTFGSPSPKHRFRLKTLLQIENIQGMWQILYQKKSLYCFEPTTFYSPLHYCLDSLSIRLCSLSLPWTRLMLTIWHKKWVFSQSVGLLD